MENRQDSSNNNDNKNYKRKRENDNNFIDINANAAKSITDLWQPIAFPFPELGLLIYFVSYFTGSAIPLAIGAPVFAFKSVVGTFEGMPSWPLVWFIGH